jgi:hypothetical protein
MLRQQAVIATLVVVLAPSLACAPAKPAAPAAKSGAISRPAPAANSVPDQAPQSGKPLVATRLPEDPALARQSELQWQEHMREEERERQLGFDHGRRAKHRAVVRALALARARYERARTEVALEKARADSAGVEADIRRRVGELDPWGTNSALLEDYAALSEALLSSYPQAKLAALRGDAAALGAARESFDQRIEKIDHWLEEAEEEAEEASE